MKKLILFLPVLAIFLSQCSNDFDVTAEWKEIPVVYAFLNPKDTAHYIRVEKAFLDPETNAYTIAKIADSLYYPPDAIAVYLEKVSTGQRFQLTRVDGNLEGYVRDTGIFDNTPNWLYKVKPASPANPIVTPGGQYKLVIVRADGKPDITSSTTVPENFIIGTPNTQQTPIEIGFLPSTSQDFIWYTDANGYFFNLYLRIPIRTETQSGQLVRTDTLLWTLQTDIEREDIPLLIGYKASHKVAGIELYRFLNAQLSPEPGMYHEFGKIDMIIEGGGIEIKSYLETLSANSGITGAELTPAYTNLSEGFGLFSSKNTLIQSNIQFTTKTIDSLKVNPLTVNLNFRK